MTAAEKLTAKALEQGRLEGEAALLLRQLSLKFGPLAASARGRVATGSNAELERWAERVLTAGSLDEVFR